MTPETIAFVGDLHCGSRYGLWPADDLPRSERYSGIRYLWDCWQHFLDWLPPEIDVLLLMGDIIDGQQRKADGTGVHVTDLSEQAEGAAEVLAPLAARAVSVLRVDGTPYHEGYHGALKLLDGILGTAKLSQVLDIDLDGQILNVAHHPSGGTAIYHGTKLSKEIIWSSVASVRRKVPLARWIVRGHLHKFALQKDAHTTVVLNPCWKLQDPYAVKGNYWDWHPDLGSVLMHRDQDVPGGYRFTEQLYDPPQPKVTTL